MHQSAPASHRLFLALWPTDEVRDNIVRWRNTWNWPDTAALVAPQRLHLTLHFLGSVPAARLQQLRQALAVPSEPVHLQLQQAQLWHGGLAVLCAAAVPPALQRLHAQLGAALRTAGLPTEVRCFRPHVTLARHAQGARPPAQPEVIEWTAAQGYVLVRSAAGRYEPVHDYQG